MLGDEGVSSLPQPSRHAQVRERERESEREIDVGGEVFSVTRSSDAQVCVA